MKKESGFTLVEVIIAIFLMLLLALGMAVMVFASRQIRFNAEVKAVATQYAERVLESYHRKTWDEITIDHTVNFQVVTDLQNSGDVIDQTFYYDVNVTGYDIGDITSSTNLSTILSQDDTDPDVKKVSVTIKWGDATSQKITMEALYKK